MLKYQKFRLLNMSTLADRITKALKHSGKTAANLAKELGITESAVSHWGNGNTKKIASDKLFAVARALNVNPEWLATGEGVMQRNRGAGASLSREGEMLLEQYEQLPEARRRAVRAVVDSYADSDNQQKVVEEK